VVHSRESPRGRVLRLETGGAERHPIRTLVAAAGALAILAGCSAASTRATGAPLEQTLVAPSPSVVVVTASGGAPREFSTGFFVRPGVVVTSGHGVEGRSRLSVRSSGGARVSAGGILAASREHDLAALDVGGEVAAPALALSDRLPRAGDSLRVIWAGSARAQRTDRVVVAKEETFIAPWGSVFEIRARLALGCSGAPVLDGQDEVVGVLVAGNPERGFFYAVPARFVRTLVAGLSTKSPARTTPAQPVLDPHAPR
jgi:S1-C subfamily serine protease